MSVANTPSIPVLDAVAISVGIVIGAGIFKTPSLIAATSASETALLLVWLTGGVISLFGALCYAELGSAYPNEGGEYYYLRRAFGYTPAFLFAWARMTVIQTGSIAMLAFLLGDYLSEIIPLGEWSSTLYAGITVIVLTGINIMGIKQGSLFQRILMGAVFIGLILLVFAGFSGAAPVAAEERGSGLSAAAIGRPLVFVLLTYSGWNEAAYLSAEVRDPQRNMVRVLLISVALVTTIYLAVNAAFLKSLTMTGMAGSQAVAADLMQKTFGDGGVWFISLLVSLTALSTMNGVIVTGARTGYALGRDYSLLRPLGKRTVRTSTPVNAYLLQGMIAMALILAGSAARNSFAAMVEYTSPVFWFFFFMAGLSLIVLRYREPEQPRPFKVPLYPFMPLAFCAVCLFMLHSSVMYTGAGALWGIGVLAAGIPLWFLESVRRSNQARKE